MVSFRLPTGERHSSTITPLRNRAGFDSSRAASALSHPNIVQIYELESQDGDDYIVMELAHGRTLAQLLREKRLSVNEALNYANQIASALAAAHGVGIVHPDIKPGNMMVSDAGVVKILDFGLAKQASRIRRCAMKRIVIAG
jgi:serine/threonine protein kinase